MSQNGSTTRSLAQCPRHHIAPVRQAENQPAAQQLPAAFSVGSKGHPAAHSTRRTPHSSRRPRCIYSQHAPSSFTYQKQFCLNQCRSKQDLSQTVADSSSTIESNHLAGEACRCGFIANTNEVAFNAQEQSPPRTNSAQKMRKSLGPHTTGSQGPNPTTKSD